MEQMLICLSIALIAGLLMSRLAKAVNLPAVTSYLVAGLLLGPFVLGRLRAALHRSCRTASGMQRLPLPCANTSSRTAFR